MFFFGALAFKQRARAILERRTRTAAHGLHLRIQRDGRRSQHAGDLAELGACATDDLCDLAVALLLGRGGAGGFLSGSGRLRATSLAESLARAGQRVSLAIYQPLDLDSNLHVALAVKALSGAAFVRLQLWELRLPEAQHVGFDFEDARDIANFEIETVRDSESFNGALRGQMRCHSYIQKSRRAAGLL